MRKLFFILLGVFIPAIAYGSVAGDFTVNRQSTYSVPRDFSKVLVLDLTLPEAPETGTLKLESIKISNAGTATHADISELMIWEDGPSAGWDNDETEAARILTTPFFDTEISGSFREYSREDSWQRIFITVDTTSAVFWLAERTVKPELVVDAVVFSDSSFNGPSDTSVIGFERSIIYNASIPTVPVTPFAKTPEALSASAIRWHFTDLSNNEFGFKILDGNLNEVAKNETANLSYLDETGLAPDTEYSGRKIVAFNDIGENLGSSLAIFPAVYTLAEEPEEVVEEVVEEEVEEEQITEEGGIGGPFTIEEFRAKIAELQEQLVELLRQLMEMLQQQVAEAQAVISWAFQIFINWFR